MSLCGWGHTRSCNDYFRRAKQIAQIRLSGLLERLSLFAKVLKSPYHFPFKELWNHDPYSGWTSPKVQVVSRDDKWLRLDICGFRFYWPIEYDIADLPWLYHEVFTPPEKNPAAYEVGPVQIQAGEWVIDGGACEGFFTAYALARGANVLAVEPIQLLCEALNCTFQTEIRQGRVRVLHGCLGEADGMTKITINPKAVCATEMGPSGGEIVPVYTIDSILAAGIIPEVHLIKMDIEGAEIAALRGSIKTLKTMKPQLTIAVYHELYNAKVARELVLAARSDYKVRFRGIYAWDGCIPRPYMLLGQ